MKLKRPVCQRCDRPLNTCYCSDIIPIENKVPVTIIQTLQESRHPLGTAKIAALGLTRCQHFYDHDFVLFKENLDKKKSPLLLFPSENSTQLDMLKNTDIDNLVVIDASWRKAKAIYYQYPLLQSLPAVSFESPTQSRYKIRKQPRENYLSTIESIVYSLSSLEGDQEKFSPLLAAMDKMINRQISAMGEEVFFRNYS